MEPFEELYFLSTRVCFIRFDLMVALRDSNYKINANICSVSQGTVPSKRDVPGREAEAEVGVGLELGCVFLACVYLYVVVLGNSSSRNS